MKTQILMSYENPKGHKLEELLRTVAQDLGIKNSKLDPNNGEVEQLVLNNNMVIISLLEQAATIQEQSMMSMDSVGQDKGPYAGQPRIGEAISEPRTAVDVLETFTEDEFHAELEEVAEGVVNGTESLQPYTRARGEQAGLLQVDESPYAEAVEQPSYVHDVPVAEDGDDIGNLEGVE